MTLWAAAPLTLLASQANSPVDAKFVNIPHGVFEMGSPLGESGRYIDEVLHTVTITRDFEMGVTGVTQLQWFSVMGQNPSYFTSQEDCAADYLKVTGIALCPNNPVEQVSWDDIQLFIKKLNQAGDGYAYRLPTEAEWEYAARAGTKTAYYFGKDDSQLDANAWHYRKTVHAVAGKTANAFGLYDMAGNVWQWTADYYGDYAENAVVDPAGPASGSMRIVRGGAYFIYPTRFFRSALRDTQNPSDRYNGTGFRLVREKTR